MNWFTWALLSAIFAAITGNLAKVGVKEIDSSLATALRTCVVFILVWGAAFVKNTTPISSISQRTWIFLILSGLATGASWLCYFQALKIGDVSQVAPIDKLSVVFAIAIAGVFLGEQITWMHGIGTALIVCGSILVARA